MKHLLIRLSSIFILFLSSYTFSQDCFDSAIGGFENSGWTIGSGDFTMDPSYVYEGSWGLTNPTGNTIHSSPIAVTGGGTIFQLSWWYWSPHNVPESSTARIAWYDSAGLLISSTTQNYTVSSYYAWENEVLYFQSPANAAYALISYRNTSNNIIYFDSNCLSHYVPEDCLDPDNGFEYGTDYTFTGGAGISTAVVYEGISSLRLPNGGTATTANIPVNGGSDYELSYYHRSQTHANAPNTIQVTFTWYDAANVQISQNSNSHNRSYRFWSNVNLSYTAPANATSLRITYNSTYPHPVYFDNSCLKEVLPPTLSISNANTDEGNNITFTISINTPHSTDIDITITYTDVTATGSDYSPSVFSIQLPAGSDSVTFSVPTTVDNIFEINETFNAEIATSTTGIVISKDTGIGSILDDEEFLGPATLDFDGVDDYLSTSGFVSGLDKVTLMGWVKFDNSSVGNTVTLFGETDALRIHYSFGTIKFSMKTNTSSVKTITSFFPTIIADRWYHITGTYSSTTGEQKFYINGDLVGTKTGITGTLEPTAASNGDFEIGRHAVSSGSNEYFAGEIDEVRVFNNALTEDQIQRMVYQEIENNAGLVRGTIIPIDIIDKPTNTTIPWSNVTAYYPMTDIVAGRATDESGNSRHMLLNNITTVQGQTAPMPYESHADGIWETPDTWLHGSSWDIATLSPDRDWVIVRINNNVIQSRNIGTLGLFIEDGASLTLNITKYIKNKWYFNLNGTLYLNSDAQLLQTSNSNLVTSANGKMLRGQQGQVNRYRYNYWASPVGAQQITGLVDNNDPAGNPNNTAFTLNMLKDDFGNPISFTTSPYNPIGQVSSYWLHTFQNGVTYYDWEQFSIDTPIVSGLGYTQKGHGGGIPNYMFEGKPNNGTILLSADDVGGPGSDGTATGGYTKTNYLVGNPYASAIDSHKFIDDNAGIISGTIYLWEHWGGNSHILNEYEGGYTVLNKLGYTKAYQFIGIEGGTTSSQNGSKEPTQYLPVAQGFWLEVVGTGDIEFNNDQRIFKSETFLESVFFRTQNTEAENTESSSSTVGDIQKIRLSLTTEEDLSRDLLLGFSNLTTDDYDYGYDSRANDVFVNDLTLPLNGEDMVIQSYSNISPDKVVDLSFISDGTTTYSIKAEELIDIVIDQPVYLRDNLTGVYHDLHSEQSYNFTSEAGTFNNRFDIVFQSEADILGVEDFNESNVNTYFNNQTNTLYVKGLKQEVKALTLYNTLGQEIYSNKSITNTLLENGVALNQLSTGLYIVNISTDNNTTVDVKIIIE